MHNDKNGLRTRLLAERRALSDGERAAAALALAGHAGELAGPGATVAAYVSVGAEPGTRPLLDALRSRGVRVLLPVLLPDNDLDWAEYGGPGELAPAGRGLLEPVGPRLGPAAVTEASVVLLPGLAVDRRGLRLGRGGGSYDRVLARLERSGAHPVLAVLLYGHELLERVPAEPHDRPVDLAVTPSGVHRLD
ncbi:5-formyltetrahydrofolate cyclo-ligase [Streptomyces rubellomurinus]|uniref:5-formyltetrahydrofolate cyclo-ligase n=2 Tax=Streptomyces TaxID=1883 RepID=A0A0F2TGC2_STRR3|nr:5-formyltetrahydrofolate cyclo-ligase [Streptomyces rubellomurinus]KJS55711.1 5-formyltetrahydrofolate cyclo-ligase [Streptomyces rubellomurinus subsp. indigoferus]KJS61591.1 5-formyltetrahydrofolate cyclo-ligase [Streptomyces rubellomurinus]